MTESRIEARIRELGYELPVAPAPVAAYVPAVTSGSYVYTSGQLPFVDGVLPYYHRTKRVDDQIAIIDAIEAGEIDDAIVKLAVFVLGPVEALAEATLANFADTHQYAISGANWADLQIRGVDKGSAVRDLQRFLGVDRSQTAVFGDAGNDLSMMSEGDLSFAMANASQDVLEAARFIAPSNNEAGVAQVLRTLLG